MQLLSVQVRGFRSIEDSGRLDLGQTTVLVGPNNSGKSTLIQAIYAMQEGSPWISTGLRIKAQAVEVVITADAEPNPWGRIEPTPSEIKLQGTAGSATQLYLNGQNVGLIPAQEPAAFIYPQLAKRKVVAYQRTVDQSRSTTIGPNWDNLVSRLARLSNPEFPRSSAYRDACQEILGFVVTTVPALNGQIAGRYVDAYHAIPLEDMGEGVSAIASTLVDLAVADGKLFLIEEPENDLHPTALKALLRLISLSSERNQFIVSTHSNIVVRYLGGGTDSRVIRVDYDPTEIPPKSSFDPIANTTAARLEVLRDLGYELSDFDLYDGWLILEEATAERLIRQYFLKWFAPDLVGRLRTVAARGTSSVEPFFEDFRRMFLYAHLESQYQGKAWVIVDGDESGVRVVESLRDTYARTWSKDHFIALSAPDFERYYPPRFTDRADEVLAKPPGLARQEAKLALLNEVLSWIEADDRRAKAAFAVSAAEVVGYLDVIRAAI